MHTPIIVLIVSLLVLSYSSAEICYLCGCAPPLCEIGDSTGIIQFTYNGFTSKQNCGSLQTMLKSNGNVIAFSYCNSTLPPLSWEPCRCTYNGTLVSADNPVPGWEWWYSPTSSPTDLKYQAPPSVLSPTVTLPPVNSPNKQPSTTNHGSGSTSVLVDHAVMGTVAAAGILWQL